LTLRLRNGGPSSRRPPFSLTGAPLGEALSGEEVVIARGKSPVVRLAPVTPLGRRQFGAYKGRIALDDRFNEPLPPEDLEGWSLT